MPLELATTIEGLDNTYPLGGDPTNKGDDHLRLIKSVIKAAFPGASGNGFSIPITATEVELNYISGLTSNAQAQFNALGVRVDSLEASLPAPTGTKLSFYNAAAPVGWTQDATKNDYMMRVVSTAGGGSGGTASPIVNDSTHTHTTGSHRLTIAEMPAHTHTYIGHVSQRGASSGSAQDGLLNRETSSQGGNATHNHGSTSSGGTNWTPKYIDMILASKD